MLVLSFVSATTETQRSGDLEQLRLAPGGQMTLQYELNQFVISFKLVIDTQMSRCDAAHQSSSVFPEINVRS